MPHRLDIQVRFNELDPYNHVNHGVYVTYFETGRAEALRWCGVPLEDLAAQGVLLFIVSLNVEYKGSATAGDCLVVETAAGPQQRKATTIWNQRILRKDEVLATAEVTVVAVNRDRKPIRPPKWLIERLQRLNSKSPAAFSSVTT